MELDLKTHQRRVNIHEGAWYPMEEENLWEGEMDEEQRAIHNALWELAGLYLNWPVLLKTSRLERLKYKMAEACKEINRVAEKFRIHI